MTRLFRWMLVALPVGLAGAAFAQSEGDLPASAPTSEPASAPTVPTPPIEKKISIIYTGKSLGALGAFQDPDEHDLLLNSAQKAGLPLHLATYTCWRAPGVTVFSPEKDLTLAELPDYLAAPGQDLVGDLPALLSNNVTMIQDPKNASPDLLAMTLENERAPIDFPGLARGSVTLARSRTPDGKDLFVVSEGQVEWPKDPAAWTQGLVNRIDVGEATLYELVVNLGEIGPRATLIERAKEEAKGSSEETFVIDLGERDGDLGLERADRARVDYTALTTLGYSLVVPYEFELALGQKGLSELAKEFPGITFLATNITPADKESGLLKKSHIVEVAGIKLGFLGMVDTDLKGVLSKTSLTDFAFEDTLTVATKEVKALRDEGVDAVIVLSNMYPTENALLAREVHGIDAIVADLHTRWSPEDLTTSVVLPPKTRSRPGSPALVARGYSNGFGVGRLELVFRPNTHGRFDLSALHHHLAAVTDRVPAAPKVVEAARAMAQATMRPRGGVLFPAFEELLAKYPPLAENEASSQERITKPMWEAFLARLIRERAGAEVAIIRELPHFPPAIGELDEADVRAWLWTEDSLVMLDITGKSLKALLAEDKTGSLVFDGIDRAAGTIHTRKIEDDAFYRIITTNLICDGAHFTSFSNAKRRREKFVVSLEGNIRPSASGQDLPLRDYVLGELARLRAKGTDDAYFAELGRLFNAKDSFEPLFTFTFDHLTLFTSFSQVQNNEAFSAVPESRANAADSLVIGATGNFLLSYDLRKYGFDLGITTAFSNQVQQDPADPNINITLETADELKFDFKARRKFDPSPKWKPQPFLGAVFDSEFTPTVQSDGVTRNPRQQDLRGLLGLILSPSDTWKRIETSLLIQDDLASEEIKIEAGFELKSEYQKKLPSLGKLSYRWTNDLRYFLPSPNDDETDLALRYNMVHEILLPFLEDLSFSVAADLLFFQGKVDATDDLGLSAILRFGLTYDRFWKPRYQSLF